MSERSLSLAGHPLFTGLPTDETARLAARCGWRRHAAGETIIACEDTDSDLFLVVAGTVRVEVVTPGGRRVILRDFAAGEFFGELAAIDGHPRSAGIRAVTAATVARMPAAVFREAVFQHPSLCDRVLRRLAGEVRRLAAKVTELGTLDVRRRLYAELLRLGRPRPGGGEATVSPPPLHADLAARIGTHREAVTRELGAMERRGLIARSRAALVIRDPAALARLVAAEDDTGGRT